MKKRIGIMILLVLLAMSSTVFAGERAGAFSISPYVGGYHFDEEQKQFRQNRMVYGLRLGYDLTDSFEVELVGNYLDGELRGARDRDIAIWNYRMDLLYNIMPHSMLVPYIAAGGGGKTVEFSKKEGGDDTDGVVDVGGGFKFFLTDNFAIRADGRYIFDFGKTGNPPFSKIKHETFGNVEYSLGLTWVFGGRQATARTVSAVPTPPEERQAAGGEAPLAPVPAAEPTPGHYKYCVTLHVEFDIDRADIRPEYRDEVAKVGDFMKKYPSTTAVIEGHTDNVGNYNHNMDLSQRRAESVVNYLVENFGIDRSRLTARGYGFTRPVADNATEEGKQKNRRIEAIIDCAFDVTKIEPPQRLCMSLVIEFDTDKADIKPEYRNEISKVADYMKQYPTTTAVIEGHTDLTGSSQENMKLSQQRADNVVNYLVQNFGIDRSRLSAKGYGATRRISYNDTPDGRAKNRRINAIIDCVVK